MTRQMPQVGPGTRNDGRERLLDAAERLYARQGIDGVSLREITRAAEQRNASVVQYHFGSRAGLVRAVVERHMHVVDTARRAMLDALESAKRPADAHEVMAVLVEPLAERLGTPGGRNYLRILQHLVDLPPEQGGPDRPLDETNQGIARAAALLAELGPPMSAALRDQRRTQAVSFLIRALADRAKLLDADADADAGPIAGRGAARRSDGSAESLSPQVFLANLIDVLVAVLTVPPSPATLSADDDSSAPVGR